MAYLVNLYKNAECTESARSVIIGQAGITGYYSNQGRWTANNWWDNNTIVYTVALNDPAGRDGVILSGATPIFNMLTQSDRDAILNPTTHAIVTDRDRPNSNFVYNHFFIGKLDQTNTQLRSATLFFTGLQYSTWTAFTITLNAYMQTPPTNRTNWDYDTVSGVSINSDMQDIGLYKSVSLYKINIWNKNWFLLADGVSAGGDVSANTRLMLIPESIFNDKPVHPYVGPVSKESAESAYVGNEAGTDSISSRDLSAKKNPFGFNSGGTMYLSEITPSVYHSIVSGIYDGTSGSPLNALGQVVSGIVGGNTHRPAEEIDSMIKGVLCCHIVPTITTYTTGSPVAIYTISGYQIQNTALAGNAVNQICTAETAAFAVKRINGSFLDFEPYTTIDLVVPFLGTVRIPASVIMDKAVKIRFAIDLLSGTLSADIIISEIGRSWVYTTLQGNCAVDMPIMGAGANANPLLKIASAAGGIATGGTLGAAAGVFNIIDGAASAAFSQPVGKCNMTNIGAFLSPRDIALIIHTPSPSNAQDFGVIVGTPSNMSGKVGDFKGYTEFVDVDLNTLNGATDAEKQEIERILMGGVFL